MKNNHNEVAYLVMKLKKNSIMNFIEHINNIKKVTAIMSKCLNQKNLRLLRGYTYSEP